MKRVLIVDDHAIIRKGIRQIFEESDQYEVEESSDGQKALELIRKEHWDIVLLGINMPRRNGLEVLQQIKREYPKMPVLVLSIYPENIYAVRCMKTGAAGYMTKNSSPDSIVEVAEQILSGGRYVTDEVADMMLSAINDKSDIMPHENLTNREYQLLTMIASGKTVTQIAHELSLSVKTVSAHRRRILEKLQLHNNTDLIQYAFSNSLVS